MSTPVLTTQHLRAMAALPDDALGAQLAACPQNYRDLLEEHMRLRDQVGTLNELALARGLLFECLSLALRAQIPSQIPTLAHVKATAIALATYLNNHDRVTLATQIGLRRDGKLLRVLFNDGVSDRIAIEYPIAGLEDREIHHWVHPAGMSKAVLDPIMKPHPEVK